MKKKFLIAFSLLLMSSFACSAANKGRLKNNLRQNIVDKAESYLGLPYSVDGKHPATGFDCSGFTEFVFNQFGFKLTGSSTDISVLGKTKTPANVQIGDLLFFGTIKNITHVGIVYKVTKDDIEMIHSSSQSGITKENISKSAYWKPRLLFIKDIISK